jgi:TRAP-type transport system periplasmic protein
VIAYNEVYNAIQDNVISGRENEAAGVEFMKFGEVAPNLAMTQHAPSSSNHLFFGQDLQGCCMGIRTAKMLPFKKAGQQSAVGTRGLYRFHALEPRRRARGRAR